MGRLKGRKMLCTREETVTRHHEHSKGHVLGKNGNQDGWGCLSVFSQLKLRMHVVKMAVCWWSLAILSKQDGLEGKSDCCETVTPAYGDSAIIYLKPKPSCNFGPPSAIHGWTWGPDIGGHCKRGRDDLGHEDCCWSIGSRISGLNQITFKLLPFLFPPVTTFNTVECLWVDI